MALPLIPAFAAGVGTAGPALGIGALGGAGLGAAAGVPAFVGAGALGGSVPMFSGISNLLGSGAAAGAGSSIFGNFNPMDILSGFSTAPPMPSQSPIGGAGAPSVGGAATNFVAAAPFVTPPAFQGMLGAFQGQPFHGVRR